MRFARKAVALAVVTALAGAGGGVIAEQASATPIGSDAQDVVASTLFVGPTVPGTVLADR
ncbi:MAG TPA: hypothetical protein DGC76_09930 [Candidatus Accumulibacter sp.]|nr:hypothetical protein [Accumulibacter sp.]